MKSLCFLVLLSISAVANSAVVHHVPHHHLAQHDDFGHPIQTIPSHQDFNDPEEDEESPEEPDRHLRRGYNYGASVIRGRRSTFGYGAWNIRGGR